MGCLDGTVGKALDWLKVQAPAFRIMLFMANINAPPVCFKLKSFMHTTHLVLAMICSNKVRIPCGCYVTDILPKWH